MDQHLRIAVLLAPHRCQAFDSDHLDQTYWDVIRNPLTKSIISYFFKMVKLHHQPGYYVCIYIHIYIYIHVFQDGYCTTNQDII